MYPGSNLGNDLDSVASGGLVDARWQAEYELGSLINQLLKRSQVLDSGLRGSGGGGCFTTCSGFGGSGCFGTKLPEGVFVEE